MNTELHFKPWIGRKSLNRDKRLMIIGESHYDCEDGVKNKPFRPNFTQKVISDVLDNSFRSNTNKNLHRLLTGENTEASILKIYDNILFLELVQDIMINYGKGKGFQKPSVLQKKIGWKICLEEIEKYEIDNIIVLGTSSFWEFFETIKTNNFRIIEFKEEEKIGRTIPKSISIEINQKKTSFYFIKHPGSYFIWQKWREFLLKKDVNLIL